MLQSPAPPLSAGGGPLYNGPPSLGNLVGSTHSPAASATITARKVEATETPGA